MKNIITKNRIALIAVFAVVVFAAVSGSFPAYAHADWYNGYGGYNHGYVSTTGFYYSPTAYNPQPIYYPQPQPIYYPQPQPIYYPQPVYTYPTLTASCYPTTSSVQTGTSVQWVANVSGGTGSYYYSWSGTDNLYGSASYAYMTYYNPGYKTASVMVSSGNQTANVSCGNGVNVYAQTAYYNYPTTYYTAPTVYTSPTVINTVTPVSTSNNAGLDIGCYSDPTNATVNQPVTWNVEVTGGQAPYKYSWTGTDGLSGSDKTAIKYYASSGSKSAIVSVTSADGLSGTMACSNSVTVGRTYTAPTYQPAPAQQPAVRSNGQAAASAFSLDNVPWGWIAVLVIIVLFITVVYLMFNKPKI